MTVGSPTDVPPMGKSARSRSDSLRGGWAGLRSAQERLDAVGRYRCRPVPTTGASDSPAAERRPHSRAGVAHGPQGSTSTGLLKDIVRSTDDSQRKRDAGRGLGKS